MWDRKEFTYQEVTAKLRTSRKAFNNYQDDRIDKYFSILDNYDIKIDDGKFKISQLDNFGIYRDRVGQPQYKFFRDLALEKSYDFSTKVDILYRPYNDPMFKGGFYSWNPHFIKFDRIAGIRLHSLREENLNILLCD